MIVNPWAESKLNQVRNMMRFTVWTFLMINAFMVCIFSVAFTFEFLVHLWDWLARHVFSEQW